MRFPLVTGLLAATAVSAQVSSPGVGAPVYRPAPATPYPVQSLPYQPAPGSSAPVAGTPAPFGETYVFPAPAQANGPSPVYTTPPPAQSYIPTTPPPAQPFIPTTPQPSVLPSETPPVETPAPEPLPAPVASRDMQVKIRVLNKSSAEKQLSTVPLGTVIQYENLEILPEACWLDTRDKSGPRSAALLQIYERKPNLSPARLFSGWMFADKPAASHLSHSYYDVAIVRCVPNNSPEDEEKPQPVVSSEAADSAVTVESDD